MEQTEQSTQAPETKAKVSQKDAVYNFIMESVGTQVEAGGKVKELLTKEVRKVVRQKLFAAVKSGDVKISKEKTDSALKKYCSGLINHWLGRDDRLK